MLKKLKLISGPFAALLICFFADLGGNGQATAMAAITCWMALWWFTEAVHLSVTALLPIVFMPLLGIAESSLVAKQYMDPIIFLFIGGFMIAYALERWNLHKRIALNVLIRVGSKPEGVLAGVMLVSYVLSMWISNTATVMMLLASVMAIVTHLEKVEAVKKSKLNVALLIGLAYSASVGGMASLVGTPTNMIFFREYTKHFPDSELMSFANWFIIGFPVSLVILITCFFILKWLFLRDTKGLRLDNHVFKQQLSSLGKISFEEKVVGLVFFITALLWFTRAGFNVGSIKIPGWSQLFDQPKYIHDSTVAVVMAMLLFLIPSKNEKGRAILVWDDIKRLPFDIILLFGGGFAMAKGLEVSGLSNWLASSIDLSGFNSYWFILIVLSALVCLISEFASNVACIQLMIPVLIAVYPSTGLSPLMLLVPATLASSLGFMLPVATAPNTIVYSSKRIHVNEMMRAGLYLDLAGVVIISMLMMLYKAML